VRESGTGRSVKRKADEGINSGEQPLPDGRGSEVQRGSEGRAGATWESRSGVRYASVEWFDAVSRPAVRYGIRRISFGNRIELARRIRDVGRKAEYLEAGSDVRDKLEATVLGAEINRVYLDWGLIDVEGMEIDGEAATPESLIDTGPVELVTEILARIKAECGLTEDERKN
jgi:hypothetical protein